MVCQPACFHFPGPITQFKKHCCVPGGPPEHTVQGAGPCPSAPSCVCSQALIWTKMSRASFQPAERGQTHCCHPGKSEESGGGRGQDVDMTVCVCVWQQWAVGLCCNAVSPVTSMEWRLQSIVRQSCQTVSCSVHPPHPLIHPGNTRLLGYKLPITAGHQIQYYYYKLCTTHVSTIWSWFQFRENLRVSKSVNK